MQNIGGENAGDAFYRYKMPKLVAKIEGRGNGIKTNVVNNVDIAKALERPPEYILKFYGCELGAQTNFDKSIGTSIVNGAHDQKKLSELLEAFIKKYVQCYSCGNPETMIKIKKEMISLKCKACGAVSDVDPRHKLNTFILKNPPENKLSKEERKLKKAEQERLAEASEAERREKKEKKKEKKDKEKKKDKKSKGEAGGEENGAADKAEANGDAASGSPEEADGSDDDEVVWMTDTSEAAMKKRAEEQLSAATAAMVMVGNVEAEAEEARKKAAKEAKKKAAEEVARRRAALESGERLDATSAAGLLASLYAEGGASPVATALRKLNVEGGLAGKMRALYEGLLGGAAKVPSVMAQEKDLFRMFASDPQSQLAQLVAFEHLFAVTLGASRSKEAAVALKLMFDEDMAAEEIILAWFDRDDAAKVLSVPLEGAKAVRAAVQPVVDWLQEAESEEESDEDDE